MAPYFHCSRVNDTTFVIHENDKYGEHPFIYVKIYEHPSLIVLSDTGCGGPDKERIAPEADSLKDLIETCPIDDNSGKALNPRLPDGTVTKQYLIICTHCHYDHILGISPFEGSNLTVLSSSHDPSFSQEDFAEHSLCKFLNIPAPDFSVSTWATDGQKLTHKGLPLNIQILHTPGHTPDELAWYDASERHLYVGDSFYQRVAEDGSYEQAILFPKEGNWIHYLESLQKLRKFVENENEREPDKAAVRVGCGHVTSDASAMAMLVEVESLFNGILAEKVPIVKEESKRGEIYATWKEDGAPRYSVEAPIRLAQEARRFRSLG